MQPKTEFVSHEIFISRGTYPSIRNFKWNSKKYALWGLKCKPKNLNKFLFLKLMKTFDMFSNIKTFGLIHGHRKFNYGYATHFFEIILSFLNRNVTDSAHVLQCRIAWWSSNNEECLLRLAFKTIVHRESSIPSIKVSLLYLLPALLKLHCVYFFFIQTLIIPFSMILLIFEY
jgi:hypothetical protein